MGEISWCLPQDEERRISIFPVLDPIGCLIPSGHPQKSIQADISEWAQHIVFMYVFLYIYNKNDEGRRSYEFWQGSGMGQTQERNRMGVLELCLN